MLQLYRDHYDLQRELIGIDLSPRMVEITRERLDFRLKVFTGDMRDLSGILSQSAAVISFFAIHHLNPEDVLAAFKEWNQILFTGGQLVLAAWEGTGSIDYGEDTDIVALRYTKDNVTTLINEAGFAINQCIVEPVEEMKMEAIYLEATKV